MTFEEIIKKKWLLFDGAMGTELQGRGLSIGSVPEALNIHNPDRVLEIHKAYVQAGAEVISTHTFGASPYKLEGTNLSVKEVIEKGIDLAKKSGAPYVALDLGPLGEMMAPLGSLSFDDAYEAYKAQVKWCEGADLILLETLSALNEARAGVLAVKENTKLPVVVSMTFQEDGRTLTGVTPEAFVNAMEGLNVTALGVNCSLGPKTLLPIVNKILEHTSLPVIVQANAGLPVVIEGVTHFEETPQAYKAYGKTFLEAGVKLLGGCCGTTPDHIQSLSQLEGNYKNKLFKKKELYLSSSTRLKSLKDFLVIGERINPTGNKILKQNLRENKIEACLKEAIRQVEAGAHILDVNVGLPGINEVGLMK
jgi:5-methyltetrahydrofolate--homocysteine methyltransferase